ncbi:MAG TPA: DUF5132 domain-containing protein [Balneolales bacterium]|nr:DUF5132 domain-containing protein [Balneolales bacterium]
MSLIENIGESMTEGVGGIFAGIGVVLVAPLLISSLRPVTKEAIKAGIYVSDKVKEFTAETGEQVADLVAEAKAEMKEPAKKSTKSQTSKN